MSSMESMRQSRRDSDVNLERGGAERQGEMLIVTPEQKERIHAEMEAELNTAIPEYITLSGRDFSRQGSAMFRRFEMLSDGKVKTWLEYGDQDTPPKKSVHSEEEVWSLRDTQHRMYEYERWVKGDFDLFKQTGEILPLESADYIKSISAKHWGEGAIGSKFSEGNTLRDLLETAIKQRGNLEGDDRNMLIEKGVDPSALMQECRYLVVKGGGEVGIVKAEDLSDDTEVKVIRTKPGNPCSLVVEGEKFPTADFGVIVIGPNEKAKPEDSEPSTKEMVWTAHPGLPIRPAKDDSWPEGSTITVADVKSKLGSGAYLQFSRAEKKEVR